MADIKKPFKETQLGGWITKNVPSAIGVIENFVPAPIKGGLDIIKNLINEAPGLTPEQKAEGQKIANDHELEMLKEYDAQSIAQSAEDTKQIQSINETMQAEDKSEHWAVWGWRPFIGFTFGLALFNNWVLVGYFKKFGVEPVVFDSNTMLVVGSILGLASAGRALTQWQNAKNNQ